MDREFAERAADLIATENRHIRPPGHNRFDLTDRVMAAYLPLQDLKFVMTAYNGVRIINNCAESVLILALVKVWEDKNLKKPANDREPLPAALLSTCPQGLTVQQLIRRLEHMPRGSLKDFPVYLYDPQTGQFVLTSGKARPDMWSIVFVPADPAQGLPVAHWTFGPIIHQDPAGPQFPGYALIYTRLPIDAPLAYWRAEVTKENLAHYTAKKHANLACDCEWWLECEHEKQWMVQHPGSRRISLNDGVAVGTTLMAQVVKGIHPQWRVTRGVRGTITVKTPSERISITNAHSSGAKRRTGFNFAFWRQKRFVDLTPVATLDVSPVRLELFEMDKRDVFGFMPNVLSGCGQSFQRVVATQSELPDTNWAQHEDLTLKLPRQTELIARLACRRELTVDSILDTLRRMSAEEQWQVDITREELELWISRTTIEKGYSVPSPPHPSQCWTCRRKIKTYRHECKPCKQLRCSIPHDALTFWDGLVHTVGFVGLWSKEFTLPEAKLKDDVVLKYGKPGVEISPEQLKRICALKSGPTTCRGRNVGPIFENQVPTCFKKGPYTGALAFLVRLGVERVHRAQAQWYALLFQFFNWTLAGRSCVLQPESDEEFLSHFSGEKLAKMQQARAELGEGWPARWSLNGFAKAEKSMNATLEHDDYLRDKPTEKPRLITAPDPTFLFVIGKWTHPQLKWLAATYTEVDHLYYAGCSNPHQLNTWLQHTLHAIADPWTVSDDITAIDSNHSEESFFFHTWVRHMQFPHISAVVEAMFQSEARVKVTLGLFKLLVEFVNASGVSDTSYKNSLLCLFIRAFAIAHAISPIPQVDPIRWVVEVLNQVYTAAAGDDGLTRLPDYVSNIHMSHFSEERYSEAWSWFGFSVKVKVIPPERWRLATFLAMRPVWAGNGYEWAPEPARRLRGLFWQLDNNMHPFAYGRGVATQVLVQSRALPVLSDICRWYLEVTPGPTGKIKQCEYSMVSRLVSSGDVTERGISEFCEDYRLARSDLSSFTSLLGRVRDPLISLRHYVLHRIFEEES